MSEEKTEPEPNEEEKKVAIRPENVRAVRLGHGANCSSVGSVIDTLFLASAVGGAIFAAVCAALNDETQDKEDAASDDEDGDHANAS
jgi:hypothetical protein